jgi:hypothetical protein
MDTRVGAVTVRSVDPLIVPEVAVIVEVPAATAVASPAELMVATVVVEEAQATEFVRFAVLPSVYVPVAANCWVVATTIEAPAGVTATLTRAGAVTVRVVDPLTEPEVAVIVVAPRAIVDASPLPLIVADEVLDIHPAVLVRFCCEPSVKVPVAVNCVDIPSGTDELAGVTAIETSDGAVTVSTVDPLMEPKVAVMVADPTAALEASPELLTGATVPLEVVQVAVLVRFEVEPSEYVPVAVNCWVVPKGIEGSVGATAIETSCAADETVRLAVPLIVPSVAVMVVVPAPAPVATPWLPEASLTVATLAAEDVQ